MLHLTSYIKFNNLLTFIGTLILRGISFGKRWSAALSIVLVTQYILEVMIILAIIYIRFH